MFVRPLTFLPASLLWRFIRALLEDCPLLRSLMSTKDWEKATPYAILSEHPDHWKPVEIETVKDGESSERNQEFYQFIWKQSCLQGTGLSF